MLLTVAVILGVLWLLGVVAINVTTPLIHVILVVALIVFIYDVVARRGRG